MSNTVDMQSIYYTATDGGDAVITFSELQSTGDQTIEVLSVTKEIKPLLPEEYAIDLNYGTITLLNELVLDANETLFVLYKIVESSVPITSLTTATQ